MKNLFNIFIIIVATAIPSFAQLKLNTSVTEYDIVKRIIASDILVTSVDFGTIVQGSGGLIYNGQNTSLGMVNGSALTTGSLMDVPNDADGFASMGVGNATNAVTAYINELKNIAAGYDVADVQYVKFNFIAQCNSFGIRYLFGSEEYEEWVGSQYNDRFGLFIKPTSSPTAPFANLALVYNPGTLANDAVTINTINQSTNSTYYVNNFQSTSIVYDGLTKSLVGNCAINAGEEYTVVLIIGDVGDAIFDSGVFLFGKGTGCYDADNCGIVTVPQLVSGCNSNNKYSVSGIFDYSSSGPYNVIVEYDGQLLTQTFSNITDGQSMNITNLTADGNYHWLTFRMGNKTSCRRSVLVKAPDPCTPCSVTDVVFNPTVCNSNTNTYDLVGNVTFSSRPKKGKLIVTNNYYSWELPVKLLPISGNIPFNIYNLPSNGSPGTVRAYFTDNPSCLKEVNYTAPVSCNTPVVITCTNCIGSFAPMVDSTYILSAWVKELNTASTVHSYINSDILLEFSLSGGGTLTLSPFQGKNKIIEGWQKIEEKFTVPSNATSVTIKLRTTAPGDALFDDIRVFPIVGNLKSFVYDPVSLKLVAELDENNYASFYEYDEEGGLVRVKKETERGVVTLKEHKTHMKKD